MFAIFVYKGRRLVLEGNEYFLFLWFLDYPLALVWPYYRKNIVTRGEEYQIKIDEFIDSAVYLSITGELSLPIPLSGKNDPSNY
jgi:hypothetical protein